MEGIRITEGRIEDTPPVVSFSLSDGYAHRVIGAAGEHHVPIGLCGEIVFCDLQGDPIGRALVSKPVLGHGFNAGSVVFQPLYQSVLAGAVRHLAVDIVQYKAFQANLQFLVMGAVAFSQDMETQYLRRNAGGQGFLARCAG